MASEEQVLHHLKSTSNLPNYGLSDYLRSGHTVSLNKHHYEGAQFVKSRSTDVLSLRGPAYPCQTVDLSTDIVNENIIRRKLHSTILQSNPKAFHRKGGEESCSNLLKLNKSMENLLSDMHTFKDEKDINRAKVNKLTFSLRRSIEAEEKKRKEDRDFEHLKPVEDFLQPQDKTSPRITGYDHGHIRSMFKLDTYGPTNSRQGSLERASGELPSHLLPNVDRYQIIDPKHTLSLSRPSTSGSISRPSTADTAEQRLTYSNLSRHSKKDFNETTNSKSQMLTSSRADLLEDMNMTIPFSLRRAESRKTTRSRISNEDRLLLDPCARRKEYHHSYVSRVKNNEDDRIHQQQVRDYRRQQEMIAELEQQRIKDFEKHLVLAKFNVKSGRMY